MKLGYLSILVALMLISCREKDGIKPAEPAGCTDPKYAHINKFTNITTNIIAQTVYTSTGSSTNYYIEQPDFGVILSPWEACNLPQEFKQNSLAVRISGYTLTYPGIEQDQPYAYPIELTRIEVQ